MKIREKVVDLTDDGKYAMPLCEACENDAELAVYVTGYPNPIYYCKGCWE